MYCQLSALSSCVICLQLPYATAISTKTESCDGCGHGRGRGRGHGHKHKCEYEMYRISQRSQIVLLMASQRVVWWGGAAHFLEPFAGNVTLHVCFKNFWVSCLSTCQLFLKQWVRESIQPISQSQKEHKKQWLKAHGCIFLLLWKIDCVLSQQFVSLFWLFIWLNPNRSAL